MQTIHPAQNGKITWQGFRNSPAYYAQSALYIAGLFIMEQDGRIDESRF